MWPQRHALYVYVSHRCPTDRHNPMALDTEPEIAVCDTAMTPSSMQDSSLESRWKTALEESAMSVLVELFHQQNSRVQHDLLKIRQNETGANAFLLACLHNEEEFINDVLELDAHYRYCRDTFNNTGLHLASKAGHLAIVKALLNVITDVKENRAFANERNDNGSSAMMFAAGFGHLSIVQFLVKHHDANPNLKNKRQETALAISIAKRKRDVAEYLTKAVQKKAIEDFTKAAVVAFGIPFILFICYRVYQRMYPSIE